VPKRLRSLSTPILIPSATTAKCSSWRNLRAQGRLDLLGITLVTGNQWLDQEQADALKAVERLGIEKQVRVYRDALYPLVHDYEAYLREKQLFPGRDYVGAYATPPPSRTELAAPADGVAVHTQAARKSAIDFLIETIHRYPNEVNILAIGPLTNLALAIRGDPTIVPLIKQTVFMGGQVDTIGNAFDDAGEFNWWFSESTPPVFWTSMSTC
jgi:purine nucleosidase